MNNSEAFKIAGNRVCFCGGNLVVMLSGASVAKSASKGEITRKEYSLRCFTCGKWNPETKKRPPSTYEQSLIEDKPISKEQRELDLKDLF